MCVLILLERAFIANHIINGANRFSFSLPPSSPPQKQHRGDFKKNKDQVLSLLVDKVTKVATVVPEAWGVCTKN